MHSVFYKSTSCITIFVIINLSKRGSPVLFLRHQLSPLKPGVPPLWQLVNPQYPSKTTMEVCYRISYKDISIHFQSNYVFTTSNVTLFLIATQASKQFMNIISPLLVIILYDSLFWCHLWATRERNHLYSAYTKIWLLTVNPVTSIYNVAKILTSPIYPFFRHKLMPKHLKKNV